MNVSSIPVAQMKSSAPWGSERKSCRRILVVPRIERPRKNRRRGGTARSGGKQMAGEGTVLEGTVNLMDLYDEEEQWMGLAVTVGEQDLLEILSELEGRRVRITVEPLEEAG